jgi:hypothetical protein
MVGSVKIQPFASVSRRAGLIMWLASLLLVAGGCASGGSGVSAEWDRLTRVDLWQDGDEWWTPGVDHWPPPDWLERPQSTYSSAE